MQLEDPHNPILFRMDGAVARITLNRPDRLNAIDDTSAELWNRIAREIRASESVGAIVLDARGPAFCAGGDVLAFAQLAGSGGPRVGDLADLIHEGHAILGALPIPILTVVQGTVAGGGLGFMLVGDYILASTEARFVSKYADIGLTPDCGVSTLLPQAVGMRRALQLTLSDTSVDAERALEWGLVTELAPAERLGERAEEILAHWLGGATAAFGEARRLIRAGVERPYSASLGDEARTIDAAFSRPEARERIAAFAARGRARAAAPGAAPTSTASTRGDLS